MTRRRRRPAAANPPPRGEAIAHRLAALRQRRAAAAADLAKLAENGEGQLSRNDPDARLLTKNGQIVAGYNVQIAVDDKHKLIVASEVVNDGNDSGQLQAMAQAAKQALGVAALTAVADIGYYNGEDLKACEDAAITAYVSPRDPHQRLKEQGGFGIADFRYDAAADLCRCPATQSCGRCAGRSVRPAANWWSAMPVAKRSAGPARCARNAWAAKGQAARD
jgi:Transposase DDE domain